MIGFLYFRCKIYFYLEDDSIQVIEPKVENSGIPQGMFNLFIIYFQLTTAQSFLRRNMLTRRGSSVSMNTIRRHKLDQIVHVCHTDKNMVEVWSTFQLCRSIKYSSTLKLYMSYKLCWCLLTGTLIRRHRIPLPPPNDEEFYTVENFNVGQEIMLYSRTFKITVSNV